MDRPSHIVGILKILAKNDRDENESIGLASGNDLENAYSIGWEDGQSALAKEVLIMMGEYDDSDQN